MGGRKVKLLFNTLRYLKLKQIVFQVKYRLFKVCFNKYTFKGDLHEIVLDNFIPKYQSCNNESFSFLNLSSNFISWNDTQNGMLWTYNLNYMDYLLQSNMSFDKGEFWIDKFIDEIDNSTIALDPYPIALRGINWIKFISLHWNNIEKEKLAKWNNSLYSQYRLLEKKLEYHLLGNHLLEDLYSLLIASIYFNDDKMYKRYSKLLKKELEEELLPDGAHYEQSPMYHSILLDRLLDCYNFSINNSKFDKQDDLNVFIKDKAVMMLGHLKVIIYKDLTFPLFNDSAIYIAPTPKQIFEYADRLKLNYTTIPLKECGYRKFKNGRIEGFVDIGDVKATYQPGHTHADTFNYELRIDNEKFIIDTGISTYDKTSRREYERGTSAHNTISICNNNSSDTWGGFRVGKRAKVKVDKESQESITASHNGFGKLGTHTRTFELGDNSFKIEDNISTSNSTISYIHLAPSVSVLSYDKNKIVTSMATIDLKSAISVEVVDEMMSFEYNKFQKIKVVQIHFKESMIYEICLN